MSLEKRYTALKDKIVQCKRDFDAFIQMLETKTTWLTAPASTRFHLSEEQGLLKHSVSVAENLLKL
jgi:23S rRNA maturation-related 3'-5' exoribonuclease YhaM